MLEHLTTEARNPASEDLDGLTALQIVQLINSEDAKVAAAVAEQSDAIAQAIDAIAERLERGGRLIYFGAGTSGRLGVLDAVECPPTFNSPPTQVVGLIAGGYAALTTAVEGAEDRPDFGVEDLKNANLTNKDAVVGIATSGRTPYVIGGLEYAQSIGAFTIGVSCNRDPQLAKCCDISIAPVVGAGGGQRLNPPQSRHRHQDGPQHAQHRLDDSPGQNLRQPDGRPAGHEYQACRSGSPHRASRYQSFADRF